ncbi:MSHA biogenesis protein MshI [Pseudoalteromonas carrageenovora]|uniref:MSHA biogenesis protein MshI n=1 Tax=Pseudoalteromonas carrageenovora IAM 12662 TaxID=1314868 RepID=A0A2K4X5S3_PSEVC|nr:MSHA biogenesis protein MshI [Pseudoalteromonas carrageenovora]MBE0381866.1 MSHA biogenesis protein MshI [Pseudoalteromonas carrageenovora IAM 12662]MCQ8890533.1 MSHA biogenesis protein MshI [Pseudoalteromonas carrageenovora]MDO6463730.1 MSHA biogenesis protein MshI [Pseudoalteromonas carrageenovora]MDO6547311.1 MSHA biogenesis protein MshI [Pseudoalteromonas carrageenovora]MDO6831759.1 MSHA biogenesis protein MshI [Pseudoalteromonas carrageenovora]
MKEKLFSWLNRSLDRNTAIGVAAYADTVNAVCLKKNHSEWVVHSSHSVNVSEQTDYTTAMVACINEVSTDVCGVNLVIPHYFYQIVQMDKPNLSDEEIIQSLPWTTKDLVDIAPENIVADFIDYPITLPMQSSKMNVFITNKLQLLPFIDSFEHTKSVLRAMTSEEMILVTLFGSHKEAHMLIVQHLGHEPRILIIRDGQLLLARRLNGFLGISDKDQNQVLVEALGLEIQRSMDFFESQLKQPPIRSIQLQCDDLSSLALRAGLAEFLQVKVVDFVPTIELSKHLEPNFYYALGAAYQLTDPESVL